MTAGLVTIAIVPGERYSVARRSLESILAHSEPSTPIVYVDAGSPPLVRQYLEQKASRHRVRLISTERPMAPNEARNLAAAQIRSEYLAFVDNDVLVSPGWLEALVDCAEATEAWVVGSVCLDRDGAGAKIVDAGASAEIFQRNGRREFHQFEFHRGMPLADVACKLRREPAPQVALHAALVRRTVFDRLGPLDEELRSALDGADLCLQVQDRGGQVYLEPESLVTHVSSPLFEPGDLPYFQLRFSDAWNHATVERFRRKWRLAEDDPGLCALAERLDCHRRLPLEPYRRLMRLLGAGPARWAERTLIAPFEKALNRRRVPAAPLAVEHRRSRAA